MPLVSCINTLVERAIALDVVSFPTDTLPALAVKPSHSPLIFELKRRSYEKPLILMVHEVAQIWHFVKGETEELKEWQGVARKYMPGALTMVLPAREEIAKNFNPLNPRNIGIRVPNNDIALEILSHTGGLATTSANLSGEDALTDMAEIAEKFPSVWALERKNLNLSGVASTVIQWENNQWKLLRQGQVTL